MRPLVGVTAFSMFVYGAFAACDQGSQHETILDIGPNLHLVSSPGPNTPVPADGVIQLGFDRLLLPATAIRQSFVLRDPTGAVMNPVVTYDPVARVVSISNPTTTSAWLTVGQTYSVDLTLPQSPTDFGARAIDGQPLDPTTQTHIGFPISPPLNGADGGAPSDAGNSAAALLGPPMCFCRDVLPIFQTYCAVPTCHGPPTAQTGPAAGMVLTTATGISNTAINVPSHGSNTGPVAQPQEQQVGVPFGIDMPIVDRTCENGVCSGNPGNSWIMYKLLLAIPTEGPGSGVNACIQPSTYGPLSSSLAPTDMGPDERARLSNYILGREMPFPTVPGQPSGSRANPTLTLDELERVRLWIQQGSPTPATQPGDPNPECGTCFDCSRCPGIHDSICP
jgi:hypothetical protein